MQQQEKTGEFGIDEARRVLGEVFAPWVMELNLSIEGSDFDPSRGASDWQPGAVLRMPFSERHAQHRAGLPVGGTTRRIKVRTFDRQIELHHPGRKNLAKHAPCLVDA